MVKREQRSQKKKSMVKRARRVSIPFFAPLPESAMIAVTDYETKVYSGLTTGVLVNFIAGSYNVTDVGAGNVSSEFSSMMRLYRTAIFQGFRIKITFYNNSTTTTETVLGTVALAAGKQVVDISGLSGLDRVAQMPGADRFVLTNVKTGGDPITYSYNAHAKDWVHDYNDAAFHIKSRVDSSNTWSIITYPDSTQMTQFPGLLFCFDALGDTATWSVNAQIELHRVYKFTDRYGNTNAIAGTGS